MKIIIIGGGQMGSYLASLLASNGHEIKIIENREKVFADLKEEFASEMLLLGTGTDPELLVQAGIIEADVVAAVTGADEVNLVVSTLAKMEFGVDRVVARVNNPKNTWLFNKGMGVDMAVNQADIMGHLIAEEMNLKDMFTLLKLSSADYSIVQMQVRAGAVAVNQYIRDLVIPKETVLIGIIREGELIIPKGDTQIFAEDHVLALTDEASRGALNSLFV